MEKAYAVQIIDAMLMCDWSGCARNLKNREEAMRIARDALKREVWAEVPFTPQRQRQDDALNVTQDGDLGEVYIPDIRTGYVPGTPIGVVYGPTLTERDDESIHAPGPEFDCDTGSEPPEHDRRPGGIKFNTERRRLWANVYASQISDGTRLDIELANRLADSAVADFDARWGVEA